MEELFDSIKASAEAHALDWLTRLALGLAFGVVGWVLARLASRATKRALQKSPAKSLAPMMGSLVRLSIVVLTIIMALGQVGVDITTMIAGAGVLGIALGFGAQTLVRDCISGFFLIIDHVIEPGDIAEIDGRFGQVETVGLRLTRVRGFDGKLWYIPNGEVKVVANFNREWVRALVPVGIAYEADLARGLEVLQQVGDAFAAENPALVLEPPEAQGVLELGNSSVGLRLVAKLSTLDNPLWSTERALRRRIKEAFDANGIEIPFPRSVVYHRQEEGSAWRSEAPTESAM